MDETLIQWLNKNAPILKKYDAGEIGVMAKLNGFSEDEVSRVLLEWICDRALRSTYRDRYAYFMGNEIAVMEEIHGKHKDLGDQWAALYNKLEYGLDYDEIYGEVA